MGAPRGKKRASDEAIESHWRMTLGLGIVVLGAVALLLEMLARTAEQIEQGVAQVWTSGKLIANNTVHIPLLGRINQHADSILESAGGIARASARIERAVTGAEEGP